MNTILCANREFGVIETQLGKQGVYRLLGKNGPGKWQPHDGIVPCPGKSVPITQETRRFWEGNLPGYGTREIKAACESLDQETHVAREGTPQEANLLLGETGEELNENLSSWERTLQLTDQKTVSEHLSTKKKPEDGLWLVRKLSRIGQERLKGVCQPLVGKALLAAAMIILATQPVRANLDEDVRAAHTKIQTLSGEEIKGLLEAIPTEQRVELVKHLPNGVIPGFLPRELAAKNLGLAPAKEIKKGFDRITQEEFSKTVSKAGEKTIRSLLAILNKQIAPTLASR